MKAPSFQLLAASLLLVLLALGLTAELGEAQSWSFAVFGDQRDLGSYGINQVIVEKMAAEIKTKNPEFVLCAGDQIHGVNSEGGIALADQYTHWKLAMDPILSKSFPVRGNHETYGDDNTPGPNYAKHWMDNIANVLPQIPRNGPSTEVGMSYSFSHQNVCIIGLEQSYATSWYQVNQPWLNEQLKANTLPFVFTYGHYPAFSLGPNIEEGSLAEHPAQRDAFWKSLADSSSNIYFAGHIHLYNRAIISIDGGPEIQQIVVGTGGAPFVSWDGKYPDPRVIGKSDVENRYGYTLVTVNGNTITAEFFAYNSTTDAWDRLDWFTYTLTSRKFGGNDANQSIDPSTLTNYYQGISLNKIGLGTLTLNSGSSTYSNTIAVTAGELDVQGDYSSAPVTVQSGAQIILVDGKVASVTVDSGGAFSGTGTVVGNLTNDGTGNLSGGRLTVGGDETIGSNGTGTFTQSGGTHALTGNLYLGFNSGANGSYNLSAGLLDPTDEYVGYSGTGTFTQSGGTNTVTGSLTLAASGGSGTYNLQGGSLTAGTVNLNGGGIFNQTGGSLNATTFNQQGGTVTGSLENQGTFNYGSGAFTGRLLNYGTANFNADFTAGNGMALYSALTLNAGRSLTFNGQGLTVDQGGAFTQTGGTLTAAQETIGNTGVGTFNQSGGTHTVGSELTLAAIAGSSGTYNLSGGSLTAGTVNLNAGGLFNQTGGTLDFTAFSQSGGTGTFTDLYLGRKLGDNSSYTLSGGSVTAANEYVGSSGTGAFTQSGGTNTVTNTLILANNPGSSGTYNLGAGSLTVGSLTINTGGTFSQTGGTLNYTTLNLRGGGFTGDLVNTGLLAGTGPITGNVTNAGTVSPGSSPGTLNIVGSYTQTTAGTYLAEIASAGSYDKISVTGVPGTATLAGTIAPTLLNGYQPLANTLFPGVLTATGGITGSFSTILNQQISPTLFWQPRYSATSSDLVVQRDYTNPGLGLNSNQLAVGTMLNSVASGTSGDLNTVMNVIDSLPASANVQEAFKQISPEKAGSLTSLGFVAANFQTRNLATRTTNLRFVQGESGVSSGPSSGGLNFNYSKLDGIMLAYNGGSLSNLFSARKEFQAPESRWGFYLDGGAAFGSQNSSVNQTGYNFTLGGFTLGADYRLRDNLLVGLATGYSNTSSAFYGSGGSVNANTIPFNAYAAYFPGSLYAYGSLGYALNLFDLKRGINFDGIARNSTSSTTGNQFNLYGETGYDLKLNRFILTPAATLAYSAMWVDGFTEQGAGSLNLKVGSQNANSLQTGLGGRLTVPLQVGSVKVTPQGYAFYQHEFTNGSRGLNASLSQGSSTLNFQTDAAKRNFALVGANVTVGLKKNLYAQINYNAEVGRGNYTAQNINAGLRLEF